MSGNAYICVCVFGFVFMHVIELKLTLHCDKVQHTAKNIKYSVHPFKWNNTRRYFNDFKNVFILKLKTKFNSVNRKKKGFKICMYIDIHNLMGYSSQEIKTKIKQKFFVSYFDNLNIK